MKLMSQLSALLEELRRQGRLESSGRFALPPQGAHLLALVVAAVESGATRVEIRWEGSDLALRHDAAALRIPLSLPEPADLEHLLERMQAAPIRIDFNGRRVSTGLVFGECLVCRKIGQGELPFRVRRMPRGLLSSCQPGSIHAVLTLGRRLFTATRTSEVPALRVIHRGVVFPRAVDLGFPTARAAVATRALALDRDRLDLAEDEAYRTMLGQLRSQFEQMARELQALALEGSGALKALARPVLRGLPT